MQDYVKIKLSVFSEIEIWPQLCMIDSDEDGRTNGAELGDPSCVWRIGTDSRSEVNLYHPGMLVIMFVCQS